MNNCKNYNTDGGDTAVIGGILKIGGGEIQNEEGNRLITNQEESTATTVEELTSDFNTLLTNLKEAGLMVADE